MPVRNLNFLATVLIDKFPAGVSAIAPEVQMQAGIPDLEVAEIEVCEPLRQRGREGEAVVGCVCLDTEHRTQHHEDRARRPRLRDVRADILDGETRLCPL